MKYMLIFTCLFLFIYANNIVELNKHLEPNGLQIEKLLGKGSFGKVYLANNLESKVQVALKVAPLDKKQTQNEKEIYDLLRKAQKPLNCMLMINYYHIPELNEAVFVLPLMDGDLAELKPKYRFKKIHYQHMLWQVLHGIKTFHDLNLVHNDIKPINILFRVNGKMIEYYLSDYSLSKPTIDPTIFHTTPNIEAPEMMTGYQNTEASDMWALGVLLLEAYSQRPLYEFRNDPLSQLYRIKKLLLQDLPIEIFPNYKKAGMRISYFTKQLKFPSSEQIDYYKEFVDRSMSLDELFHRRKGERYLELEDFIRQCLQWLPEKRITAEQALKHSFFQK